MAKCTTCGKEFSNLEKCEYCEELFCKEDYLTHMTWERRHKGLAEEEGKFWREHREAPS